MIKFQQVKTPPVGFCIYCNADGRETKLTDEHALPYGLEGSLVLAKASCRSCAAITGSIERYVLREMLGNYRVKVDMQTRRPKARTDTLPLTISRDGVTTKHQIPVADHPGHVSLPIFGPVHFLSGTTGGDWIALVPPYFWTASDPNAASPLARMKGAGAWNFDPTTFCLFLAKVAHCLAILQYGYGNFQPFLPQLIIERSGVVSDYVGGARNPGTDGRPMRTHLVVQYGVDGLIEVFICLLVHMGAPYYRIVVGRLRAA